MKRWDIHSGILFSHKNEILPFAAMWLEIENILFIEINQRKTNTVYHLYVESKIYYKRIYAKQNETHNKKTS